MNPVAMRKDVIIRLSPSSRKRFLYYGLAILLPFAALLVRLALAPFIGGTAPYLTFFLATVLSAGLGGFWPGMVTTIIGALLAGVFLPQGGLFHVIDPSDRFGSLRFLLVSMTVSYMCQVLIGSRERAEAAERRLRDTDRIYRAIGESIPYGLWICDAEGRNTFSSDSFLNLVGMTQQECSAMGWGKVLHPEDADRTLAAWTHCVRTGGTWDMEHRFLGKDGRYHPILARGVPVRDDLGRIIAWAGINLDISRLKETQAALVKQAQELARSNRELEQFAFVASHDLQEPLRGVNIYTELLLKHLKDRPKEELDQFASFVHEGVEKMDRMIRDLLSFSRVIQDEAEWRPVDAGAAFHQAENNCASMIQESGAVIECGVLPTVMAAEAHIIQVFQNLLSNAIKYRNADRPPRISVRAEEQGNEAVFVVEDNGIGFDPIYAEQIFGLFKRLHGKQYAGNGLGLSICQRIVERYGGRIWAESTASQGSKFFFTFPLAEEKEKVPNELAVQN